MRLCRLNAETGRLISETILDDREPESKKNFQVTVRRLDMPPALPDVLSCDGRYVYMRSQRFDLEGKRAAIVTPTDPAAQGGETAHLFCPIGFLDGSWFHRSYWLYGRTYQSGCNWWFRAGRFAPAARLMVFDDATIYGYGRKPMYYVWSPALEYRLYAAQKDIKPEALKRVTAANREMERKQRRAIFNREVTKNAPLRDISASVVKWSQDEPALIARAMALAGASTKLGTGTTLFVAGPPDVLDEEAAVRRRFDADVQKRLGEQDAALAGRKGALLWAVSAVDGKRLAELRLDATPVWDGMAAAGGRLYLATTEGKVCCFAGK